MIKNLLVYIELIIIIIIASGFEHMIFHGPQFIQFYERISPLIPV